jgi:transposase
MDLGVFYTHQEAELPDIAMLIRHFLLHKGQCKRCGKVSRATIPTGHQTGYGPKLSALIALLSGDHGDSRLTVQRFCTQFLGLEISTGAIQKVLNRVSKAIKPHYDAIEKFVHSQEVNHVDETPWYQKHAVLQWLWVLCNNKAAFFRIHANRNKKAFKALIGKWEGILVSDNYGVYTKWVDLHQTCLAHLIRKAKKLADHKDQGIAKFGTWACNELRLLVSMANAPPTKGEWAAFYARLCRLIAKNKDRKDQAGTYARTLEKLIGNLWIFLEVEGVDATNNLAERMLRAAVIWRKRSFGAESETGDRWVERILTLIQTCRLQKKLSYPVLVDAIDAYLFVKDPDINWIKNLGN